MTEPVAHLDYHDLRVPTDGIPTLATQEWCDPARIAREASPVIDTANATEGLHHFGSVIRL
jgi:hypothetical protein